VAKNPVGVFGSREPVDFEGCSVARIAPIPLDFPTPQAMNVVDSQKLYSRLSAALAFSAKVLYGFYAPATPAPLVPSFSVVSAVAL